MFPFEYVEVNGVRAGNTIALAVDDQDGESYFTFVIIVCLGIMAGGLIEFLPDGFLHFLDGLMEPAHVQVDAIDAHLATLTVEDGAHIAAVDAAFDGVIKVGISDIAYGIPADGHRFLIPYAVEVVVVLGAELHQFYVGAVGEMGVGLKPAALTLEVVWLEGGETADVLIVESQFALEGLEHLLRRVEMVLYHRRIVPRRYFDGPVHRIKLAVKTIDDIRGTHAADHRRDHEDEAEYGADDEHIDEADDHNDAPGDASRELALLFLEDVHN